MRIAVHGMITDSGGSSAGSFSRLLRSFLELGHTVDMFGVKKFSEPQSLVPFPGYRFHALSVPWNRKIRPWVLKLKNRYAEAALSTAAFIGFHHLAIQRIEANPEPFDFVLSLDNPNLWRSRLPVLSWPQAPPHTEWAALRRRHIARSMVQGNGAVYYGAVQAFYAWRWMQGKAALRSSDLILVGSPWAREEWIRFGLDPARVELQPYPIDLENFATVPAPDTASGVVTFLWLGRSVPRKRMDLFLDAFKLLERRRPNVRARLVGHFSEDRSALALLESFRSDPAVEVSAPIARAEVPRLFGETHVLVQPSENENFGFSIAEALAAGRPVVAGPTNGTAAFGGEALFGFERYNASDVAAAMERAASAVLADPVGLAERARGSARRHFEPHAVAARVTALAESLIARKR